MANPYAANPCSAATEDVHPTTEGNGLIRIKRSGGYWERAPHYTILVDDAPVARLRKGESAEIPVASGWHKVRAKVYWCESREVPFDIAPDESVEFECSNRLRGLRVLLTLFYCLVRRHDHLMIERMVCRTGTGNGGTS